ncbi:hypothetical protein GCM10027440_21070 [Nocardiopsis coralliicola]
MWAAGAVLLAAACGEIEPDSLLSEKEARERVEMHVRSSIAGLPEEPDLRPFRPPASTTCREDVLVTVTQRFWLDGLSGDSEAHVDAVVAEWEATGFEIVTDERPEDTFVSAVHEDDGFSMSIKESVQGDLSIGATSPCLHPDGIRG